ncbi:hypothetical protein V2W45_113993 [Cenococcum geophilum]
MILAYYSIQNFNVMHLVLRLRGGGGTNPVYTYDQIQPEMGIAAGGLIKQAIVRDTGRKWLATQTKTFNMQVLNTLHFRHVTGFQPSEPPIDARTYATYGYPFFSMYEEPSDVSGDFSLVKSIGHPRSIHQPQD